MALPPAASYLSLVLSSRARRSNNLVTNSGASGNTELKMFVWLFSKSSVSGREVYLVASLGAKMASEFHPLVAQIDVEWRGPLAMLSGCAGPGRVNAQHV